MRGLRVRRRHLCMVGQLTVPAVLILVAALWLSGCGQGVLPQDGTYQYGQSTIVIDSFEAIHSYTTGGDSSPYTPDIIVTHHASSGCYFPALHVIVTSPEGCALFLTPELHTTRGRIWRHSSPDEVVLAAGESKTILWRFGEVDWDDPAKKLVIKVCDPAGKTQPGEAVFMLGEPTRPYTPGPGPAPTTTTVFKTQTTMRGPTNLEFDYDAHGTHETVIVGDHIKILLDLSASDITDVEWRCRGSSGVLLEQATEAHRDGPYFEWAVGEYEVVGTGRALIELVVSTASHGERDILWFGLTLDAKD